MDSTTIAATRKAPVVKRLSQPWGHDPRGVHHPPEATSPRTARDLTLSPLEVLAWAPSQLAYRRRPGAAFLAKRKYIGMFNGGRIMNLNHFGTNAVINVCLQH